MLQQYDEQSADLCRGRCLATANCEGYNYKPSTTKCVLKTAGFDFDSCDELNSPWDMYKPGTGKVWAAGVPDAASCKFKCTDIEECQGYTFQPSGGHKACSLHLGLVSAKSAETDAVS